MYYPHRGGGHVYIPGEFPSYPVEPETAASVLLALEIGVIIPEIRAEEDLLDLFERQGHLLLENWYQGEVNPILAESAMRNINKTHKREIPFFDDPADGRKADPTQAKVLIPYLPQYGFMHREEQAREIPTHMTFGLKRVIRDNDDNIVEVRAARTNIWLARDSSGPVADSMRVIKDTHGYRTFENEAECERYLDSRRRKQEPAGFIIKTCLGLNHPG